MIYTFSPASQQHGDHAQRDVARQQRGDRPVHSEHRHGRTFLCSLHVQHRIIIRARLSPGGHFEVRVIFLVVVIEIRK